MSNIDRVLTAITEYWRENAIPPTIRSVQELACISSTSLVRFYYQQLETAGEIKRIKGKPVPMPIYQLLKGDQPRGKEVQAIPGRAGSD